MRTLLAISLPVLACLCACSSRPSIEAARSVSGQIGNALNSSDTDRLGANLMDDAVLVRGNAPTLVGRDAIVASYAAAFKQIGYNVSLLSEAIERADEFVIDRGRLGGTVKSADTKTSEPVLGKYFHILKLETDGAWKVWRAVWTFDNPTAATSCDQTGARSCCCKDIGGNDCIARPNDGCTSTYPVPILLP